MIKITPLDSAFVQSCERFSQAPSIIGAEIAILGRSNVGKSSLINALLNHKNLAKSSATPGKTRLINFFISRWQVEKILQVEKRQIEKIAESFCDYRGDSNAYNISQDSTHLAESATILDSAKIAESRLIKSKILAESNSEKSTNKAESCKISTSKRPAYSANLAESPKVTESFIKQTFTIRLLDFPGFGYAKISKSEKKSWDRHLSDFLQRRDSIKLYLHLLDSRHENLAIDSEISTFLQRFKKGDSTILEVYTKSDKLSKNKLAFLRKQGKILTSTMDKKSIESLRFAILKIIYNADSIFHANNSQTT